MAAPAPAPLVVWLSGNSGAGKTFTGDALQALAGFHHLDGDELMWSQDPAEKALWAGLVAAFAHWFEGRPAPPEQWQPLFALQCARVRAALAAGHARVVVSLTVYHRETRDYLRAHLPGHVFVLLRCGREELVRRARVRFAEYAASRGESIAAAYEHAHGAPYSEEAWLQGTHAIMRGLMPLAAEERGCHEVDVTDGRPWRALYAVLGLGQAPEDAAVPVEQIAAVNYARFKRHAGGRGDGGGGGAEGGEGGGGGGAPPSGARQGE
jgi:gluconate kinase